MPSIGARSAAPIGRERADVFRWPGRDPEPALTGAASTSGARPASDMEPGQALSSILLGLTVCSEYAYYAEPYASPGLRRRSPIPRG